MELYARAAELGSSKAHYHLGNRYRKGGNSKKAKFHYEAAAMLGCEVARFNLGVWRHSPETWNKLLSIGRLPHQLGVIKPFIPC
jgi:TPR repeat protein